MKANKVQSIIHRGGVFSVTQHEHDANAVAEGLSVTNTPDARFVTSRSSQIGSLERHERISEAWLIARERLARHEDIFSFGARKLVARMQALEVAAASGQ